MNADENKFLKRDLAMYAACSKKRKVCVDVNETDAVLAKEFTQTYRNIRKQRENPRKVRTGSKAVKNGLFSREDLKTH